MVTWTQMYMPMGGLGLSALVALIPIIFFFVALAVLRLKGHVAGAITLILSILIAIFAFKMPIDMAFAAAGYGFIYGLWPIAWIIVAAVFLYKLTVASGQFDIIRSSVISITDDQRLQVLLIGFSFGALLEWWLSLPIIVIYPLLFGWVSYQTATKLAEHKRRLQVMSTRDGMTGVYNRRHWETMLRNEFDNCRRHNRDATLLIIDIDHFKSINDTWGHDVGDEAIVALTRQLQITLRGSDVIGRFGGDEFAVIMSGTPAESAITAMLRVHEGLNTLRLPNTPQVTLRISVGVAPLNPQMSHYREWLKSADLALYKAKKAGRNRTEVAA